MNQSAAALTWTMQSLQLATAGLEEKTTGWSDINILCAKKIKLIEASFLGEELMVDLLGKRWICSDVSEEQQLRGGHRCNLCPS